MAELKEQTIEKEFVPYDLALELKKLGFEEECFAFYGLSRDDYKTIRLSIFQNLKTDYLPDVHHLDVTCDAPLFQQAFRFFREQLLLDSCIIPYWFVDGKYKSKRYTFSIEPSNKLDELFDCEADEYDTYEEAELECLVKLIDIVKKKNLK